MQLQAGTTVESRYRIDSLIGEGATSRVYLAQDLMLNIDVAIKLLDLSQADNTAARERFVREAKT